MNRFKKSIILILIILFVAAPAFAKYSALMLPKFKWFDASTGDAASGWTVYLYENGTATPKVGYGGPLTGSASFTSKALDSKGEGDFWLDGNYTIVLKDADDVTQWTLNDIEGSPNEAVISRVVASNAALLALSGETDGELAIVQADPVNFYTWDIGGDKWRPRTGNIYTTAGLPTSTNYTIVTGSTAFDSTVNQIKFYNGSAWLPAAGNILRFQVFN